MCSTAVVLGKLDVLHCSRFSRHSAPTDHQVAECPERQFRRQAVQLQNDAPSTSSRRR
jgi:hypothetical protein